MSVRNSYHESNGRQGELLEATGKLLALVCGVADAVQPVGHLLGPGWGACAWVTPRAASKDEQRRLAHPGKSLVTELVAHTFGPVETLSASHTSGISVAVAGTAAVGRFGVDVIREFPERAGLARRIFSSHELSDLAAAPNWRQVLRAAVLKEAAYKSLRATEQRGVTFRRIRLTWRVEDLLAEAHVGQGPAVALAASAMGEGLVVALAMAV